MAKIRTWILPKKDGYVSLLACNKQWSYDEITHDGIRATGSGAGAFGCSRAERENERGKENGVDAQKRVQPKYCHRQQCDGVQRFPIFTSFYLHCLGAFLSFSHTEPSKKMNKEPLSNYQQREIKVRQKTDPDTRYYTFFPKGDTYDQRRQLKAREGLSSFQSKRVFFFLFLFLHLSFSVQSSLLGTGRGDLPSYGVEDNFGKSVYLEQESQRHHTATSSIFDSTLSVVQGRTKQDRAQRERNEEVESVRNLP